MTYADAATLELTRPFYTEVTSPDRPVPLMSAFRPDPRLGAIAEKCQAFLSLPENWNSYRAKRIDESLVQNGLQILAMVLAPAIRTPEVVPTVLGGVQIEWHSDDADLEVEVRGLGRYHVFHRLGDDDKEFELVDDISRLTQLLASFPK